jgi:hypothetical protein
VYFSPPSSSSELTLAWTPLSQYTIHPSVAIVHDTPPATALTILICPGDIVMQHILDDLIIQIADLGLPTVDVLVARKRYRCGGLRMPV